MDGQYIIHHRLIDNTKLQADLANPRSLIEILSGTAQSTIEDNAER